MKRILIAFMAGLFGSLAIIGSGAHGANKPLSNGSFIAPESPGQAVTHEQIAQLDKLAAAAFEARQYGVAAEDARQSISLGQDPGIAQEILAESLDAEGDSSAAISAYEKINAGDVDGAGHPRDLLPYALLLLHAGDWKSALDAYDEALPLLSFGNVVRADSHFTADDLEPADLATAIHIALGLMYKGGGDLADGLTKTDTSQKSLSEFRSAQDLEPKSPLANYYYGDALMHTGHKAQAMQLLKNAASATNDPAFKKAAEDELKR